MATTSTRLNSRQPPATELTGGRQAGPETQAKLTRCLWRLGWLPLPVAGALWLLLRQGIFPVLALPGGCLIRSSLGIFCPACGGTRAIRALLQGQLLTAMRYNPAVPCAIALWLAFQLSNLLQYLSGGRLKVGLRFRPWLLYVVIAAALYNLIAWNFGLNGMN